MRDGGTPPTDEVIETLGEAEWDEWQHEVAAFVLGGLRSPPCRVLDVGCGRGWLVRALAARGYDALGIDPEAPEDDPLLTRARLEEFEPDDRFDALLAVLPLHHIDDLDLAVDRMVRLVRSGGRILCVEFAWDRFDDATARWCLERLPSTLDDANWLQDVCGPLRERQRRREPLRTDDILHDWAASHGLHASVDMLGHLRERLDEQRLEWGPYLYPGLDVDAATERAAIEAGRISPMSFRFVGDVP